MKGRARWELVKFTPIDWVYMRGHIQELMNYTIKIQLVQSGGGSTQFHRMLTSTPKMCRILAIWVILEGFGPLCYLLWG